MEELIFSRHAIEQMGIRNIPIEMVTKIPENPQEIIIKEEQAMYQSVITFGNSKEYLVRIIVNSLKNPKVVITVYKTSNLKKYYEGKIR